MKRFTAIIIVLALLICALPAASATTMEDIVFYEVTENGENIVYANNDGTRATYKTIIMQGNTYSASDCRVFKEEMLASGNGYTTYALRGWNTSSDVPNTNRVTESQFKEMKNYHVAYYSGHGGFSGGHPIVNYVPSNSSQNYGTSSPINVATALGVSTSNWQNNAYIKTTDPTRVLVLAACSQLDSNCVKYYARIMKASSIRAIAGYHDVAPSDGDDVIARNFVETADAGNSIMYSWQNANPVSNWAVLVYQSNYNQYYRFPGFPGNTYSDPTDLTVYRYANYLSTPGTVTTSLGTDIESMLLGLPLSITTTGANARTDIQSTRRELDESLTSVADNDNVVQNYLLEYFSEDLTSDKVCVESYVTREEADTELGLLSETETVVERTYNYYDTYNGIKIADSYVGASVDVGGVKNVSYARKEVLSAGKCANELSAQKNAQKKLLTKEEAVEVVRTKDTCCSELTVLGISLAYAPVNGGEHVLCYEIQSNHGFTYVSVENGNIINLV